MSTIYASHENPFDIQAKLLMIGDSGVGKTSMLLRYTNNMFSDTFITTIGIDFKTKLLTMDHKRIKLQIWDTAGQERFRTITVAYFRGAQGVMLIYDVTNRESFNNINRWMKDISKYGDSNVIKMLIGNKSDSADRIVTTLEGEQLADQYGIKFYETSAFDGQNIEKAFYDLGKECVNKIQENQRIAQLLSINVDSKDAKKRKMCC